MLILKSTTDLLLFTVESIPVKQEVDQGSGCGSVGRMVASNSRGPWFKSSHRQKFILNIYRQLHWKDENKEKEAGNGPFLTRGQSYSDTSLYEVSVITSNIYSRAGVVVCSGQCARPTYTYSDDLSRDHCILR